MAEKNGAIVANGVYKDFVLPHEKTNSIKGLFTSSIRKKSGSETQHALKDINIHIKEGEFFGILGRNGSGKSTLLKILAGIYQPTKGEVKINGNLVPFIELGVGFNPELSGRENVYLNGALLGFTRSEIDELYDDIVSFAELEDFMDQKLKNYSSGMQVRLAFSVATRAKAAILLVDEVLAVGDADFQRKCFNYFKQLKKTGTTVVFVTHDMSAVREYCDRAILIEKSEIVAEGKPDVVATKYTKLFQADNGRNGLSKDEDRWGDGVAEIIHKQVTPKSIKDNDTSFVLEIDAKAHKALEAIVIGFVIKNAAGQPICGTNSLLKEKRIKSVKAGEVIKSRWTIPNIFRDGSYVIDTVINHDNGIDVHDWWQEAIEFKAYSKEYSQYVVNPPITVELERG